jgi:predicted phosphoadenosine phosphosulfate sulfurtransferase
MPVEYKDDNVLIAARKRISKVFDDFENVVVSVSSGKDSTVLYHLCLEEARRRKRKFRLFFLDQEVEYCSTIDLIEEMMKNDQIEPAWVQVPLRMTNATSHVQYFLRAWGDGDEWMRSKSPLAIHQMDGAPDRFYDFFEWYACQGKERTAWIVGLRSKESLNRFRAVTSYAGWDGLGWSSKTKSDLSYRFYPIYDWTFGDVWKFIVDNGVAYNRYYDKMFAKYGQNMSRMRVSNLIHEKSFRCLCDLQEFEPETYEKLLKRLNGVHAAALYCKEPYVYDAKKLPDAFDSWRKYRDYLLETTPISKVDRFRNRFDGQDSDEETCRQQVKQILINDWENNVPVIQTKTRRLREIWWDRL